MDKILKIKFIIITLYFTGIILFFYDAHFLKNSVIVHDYGNIPFMFAVLSLGVLISATVYNLAFYFYIKNRQYLYYALAQLAILMTHISYEAISINPFIEIYNFKSYLLFDVSQVFIVIFSALFLQGFFNTYLDSKFNQVVKIVLYLSLLDLFLALILGHTIITKFVPTFIWVWLILSEAHRHIQNKDIPFYLVSIGWHVVIITVILTTSGILSAKDFDFPFGHIAFAIESMLLSFALSYKFKLIEDEKRVQQTLLLQQSRLASMGEMISIIAHQWRQPLNFLSYSFMHIKNNCKNDDDAILTIKEANEQLQYMSQTIENFRNFYNPSKNKESFSIEESSNNILKIVTPTLTPLRIKIKIRTQEDFSFFANSNEFEQVILNLVNNAKDALIERKIKEPTIHIDIQKNCVSVCDNAGGILKENQNKIFEPYFSTKTNSDGIGLYIAKTIIETEMQGRLSLETTKEGSCFIIEL
jgi:signal transduction histidine kinase